MGQFHFIAIKTGDNFENQPDGVLLMRREYILNHTFGTKAPETYKSGLRNFFT